MNELVRTIKQTLQAVEALSEALIEHFGRFSPDDYRRREERIRKLLDIENDENAPQWVQQVNQQRIDTFGSGNGRIQ